MAAAYVLLCVHIDDTIDIFQIKNVVTIANAIAKHQNQKLSLGHLEAAIT